MDYILKITTDSDALAHHGVKGMKWGKHLKKSELAEATKDVIRGKYGNGDERKKALGKHYDQIQKSVNDTLKPGASKTNDDKSNKAKQKDDQTKDASKNKNAEDTKAAAAKRAAEIKAKVAAVIAGKYGNGDDRKKALGNDFAEIQNAVNERLGVKKRYPVPTVKTSSSTKKSASSAKKKSKRKTSDVVSKHSNTKTSQVKSKKVAKGSNAVKKHASKKVSSIKKVKQAKTTSSKPSIDNKS